MLSSTRGWEDLGCDFFRQGISAGRAQIQLLSGAVVWTEPFSERNFVLVEDLVGRCLASSSSVVKGGSSASPVLQPCSCCPPVCPPVVHGEEHMPQCQLSELDPDDYYLFKGTYLSKHLGA